MAQPEPAVAAVAAASAEPEDEQQSPPAAADADEDLDLVLNQQPLPAAEADVEYEEEQHDPPELADAESELVNADAGDDNVDSDGRHGASQKRRRQRSSAQRPTSTSVKKSRRASLSDSSITLSRAQMEQLLRYNDIQGKRLAEQRDWIREMQAENEQLKQDAANSSLRLPTSSPAVANIVTVSNDVARVSMPASPSAKASSVNNASSLSGSAHNLVGTAQTSSTHFSETEQNRLRGMLLKMKQYEPSAASTQAGKGSEPETAVQFCQRYRRWMTSETPATMLKFVGMILHGDAASWYDTLTKLKPSPAALVSWDAFEKALVSQFDQKLSFSVAQRQLQQTKKLANETYAQHMLRFDRARGRLPANAMTHYAAVDAYLGTLDTTVSRQVKLTYQRELANISSDEKGDTPSLVDISQWAMDCQQALEDDGRGQLPTTPSKFAPTQTAATSIFAPAATLGPGSEFTSTSPWVSPNYRGKNPKAGYPQQFMQTTPTSSTSMAGAPAGTVGSVPNSGGPPSQPYRGQGQRVCFGCQQPGHIKANCPNRQAQTQATQPRTPG